MGDGFLPVPRSFQDDPIWQDPAWLGAYTKLQMRAAWAPHTAQVGDERIDLDPGQLLFSQREFAETLGWGRRQIRTFMDHLEDRGLVEYPYGKQRGGKYVIHITECWYVQRRRGVPTFSGKHPNKRTNFRGGKSSDGNESQDTPPEKRTNFSDENADEANQGSDPPISSTRSIEEEEETTARMSARAKLGNCYDLLVKIGLRGHEPPGYGKKKQRGKLKQMIEERGYQAVVDAIKGARRTFPYNDRSRPKPYDAFSVSKRFDVYVAEWRSREHQDRKKSVRKRRAAKSKKEAEKRAEAQHEKREEWYQEIDRRFEKEDPDLKSKIRTRAVKSLPDRDLSDATKEAILTATIRQMYAKAKGLRPPQSTNP